LLAAFADCFDFGAAFAAIPTPITPRGPLTGRYAGGPPCAFVLR
jgi:hypothetical protein